MKNTTVDPDSGDWEQNDTKRLSDQTLFRALSFDLGNQYRERSESPLRVLSFPGSSWMWEQALDEAFSEKKFKFKGLERDTRVFKKAKKQADILPSRYSMFPSPISYEGYRETRWGKDSQFDLIYLDWMGTWSQEKKEDLEALLRGTCSLAVGGVLIFTVSLCRGRPELAEQQDLSYDLPMTFYDARGEDKYVSNLKVRGIPHWVQDRAMDGFRIKLRPIMANIYYAYCGKKGQTLPQLQLMFLREESP